MIIFGNNSHNKPVENRTKENTTGNIIPGDCGKLNDCFGDFRKIKDIQQRVKDRDKGHQLQLETLVIHFSSTSFRRSFRPSLLFSSSS